MNHRMTPWCLLAASNVPFYYQTSKIRRTQDDDSRKIEMGHNLLQGIPLMNESRAALKKDTDKGKKAKKSKGASADSGSETESADKVCL